MIGFLGMAGSMRRASVAIALAAGMSAMPDLGQQRTLSSRPGSGLVRRSGGRSPRPDHTRQHMANVKRHWKDARRRRHMMACFKRNPCAKGSPFVAEGVSRGQ